MIIRIFQAWNDHLDHGDIEFKLGEITSDHLLDPSGFQPLQQQSEIIGKGVHQWGELRPDRRIERGVSRRIKALTGIELSRTAEMM